MEKIEMMEIYLTVTAVLHPVLLKIIGVALKLLQLLPQFVLKLVLH